MSSPCWYFEVESGIRGPVPPDELGRLAASGVVRRGTRVRHANSESWYRAESLSWLTDLQAGETPQSCEPAAHRDDAQPAAFEAEDPTAEYKVVPFVAVVMEREGVGAAAQQLAQLINEHKRMNWTYVRLENVEINVHDPGTKGCLDLGCWGVVPPSQRTVRYDMLVFRRGA